MSVIIAIACTIPGFPDLDGSGWSGTYGVIGVGGIGAGTGATGSAGGTMDSTGSTGEVDLLTGIISFSFWVNYMCRL